MISLYLYANGRQKYDERFQQTSTENNFTVSTSFRHQGVAAGIHTKKNKILISNQIRNNFYKAIENFYQ